MSFCFYHNDMDGKCAGAIVNQFHPGIELRPVSYGQPFPFEDVAGHLVYMVDYSLQPFSLMERLNDVCELYWIDHHKSAIEDSITSGFVCDVQVLEVGKAACELAWEYFFPHKPLPRAVYLLGRYDTWDHCDPDILPFQYAMRSWDMSPSSHGWWEAVFSLQDVDTFVEEGNHILSFIRSHNVVYSHAAFVTRIDGWCAIAINRMYTNSSMFDEVYDNGVHDLMLTFGWRHGQWTVSLYADKDDVDVSVIAKNHGGGGHKGAAGFQCDTLPFALK